MQNDTENFIKLYFIKSPYGIDWNSATTVARGIIKNYISRKPRFMGHVNIELRGTLPNGEKIDILTGMVAKSLPSKKLLFLKKIGMGIIYHSFHGHLETREELEEEIKNYQKENQRINFLTFKISSEILEILYRYYQEYRDQNISKYYGLYNRPLYKEGGGCSAFGASFLQLAGLMTEELEKSWTWKIKIPMDYIGMPIQKKKVNFLSLLLFQKPWADEKTPYKEIYFWDPDKMYAWVNANFEKGTSEFVPVKENEVRGLFKDMTTHKKDVSQIWMQDDRELPLWEENNW